jgi:hypothetical protein
MKKTPCSLVRGYECFGAAYCLFKPKDSGNTYFHNVGFEVFTAVVLKSIIFGLHGVISQKMILFTFIMLISTYQTIRCHNHSENIESV